MNQRQFSTTLGAMRQAYLNSAESFLCDLILEMMGGDLRRMNDANETEYEVDLIEVFREKFSDCFKPKPDYAGSCIDWYIKDDFVEIKDDLVDPDANGFRVYRNDLLVKLCEKYGCDFELTFTISKVE